MVNCVEQRSLNVHSGTLQLKDGEDRVMTRMPFQKILALFVVGNITITTPLLEKCRKHGVALVVVKPSLRPCFWWANEAEANFVLHRRQYALPDGDIGIARRIVENKISNQVRLLKRTRIGGDDMEAALEMCRGCLISVARAADLKSLLGAEGAASRAFFGVYYGRMNWKGRLPRTKCDIVNATLDIGYTILFNFTECFLRMFGFDLYVGVYHRDWFRRKSLVCDIMEPFRCIIDLTVRSAFYRRQFTEESFEHRNGQYILKNEAREKYLKVFFEALVVHKEDIFLYVRNYYKCFMAGKDHGQYPTFQI